MKIAAVGIQNSVVDEKRTPETNIALIEAERTVRSELFTSDSDDVTYAEFEVLRHLNRNPRQIKRFDNAFRLQLYVENSTPGTKLDFTRDQLVAIAKGVALRLRWPTLAEAIDRDAGLLKALEQKANGEAVGELPKDSPWHRWLDDKEVRDVLKETNQKRRLSSLDQHSFLRIA